LASISTDGRGGYRHGTCVAADAGDIATCNTTTSTNCKNVATSDLVAVRPDVSVVFTAGDQAYDNGSAADYANYYHPSWGRFKTKTKPSLGNHEYGTTNAAGYFGYFNTQLSSHGPTATDPAKGYYSYDAGSWHVVVLTPTAASCPAPPAAHSANGSPPTSLPTRTAVPSPTSTIRCSPREPTATTRKSDRCGSSSTTPAPT
jgi:hypothetical protein